MMAVKIGHGKMGNTVAGRCCKMMQDSVVVD